MNRCLTRFWTLGIVVVAAVALTACKAKVTPINTLLEDPSRYDHQTVRIAGEVRDAIGALGYGAYMVNDGTGSLLVVTTSGGAPRSGAKVGVEGTFRSGFTLGTETQAAIQETQRFTP
jgi:hypothetical protein